MKEMKEPSEAEIEALAKAEEARLVALKPKLFADAHEEHKKDSAGFRFKCSRWGDWLTVSIARPINEHTPTFSAAINLKLVKAIRLVKGYIPDLSGVTFYEVHKTYRDGDSKYSAYVTAMSATDYTRRILFKFEDNKAGCFGGQFGYMGRAIATLKTENTVRYASDDRIEFDGMGATLFAPALLGEDVYKTLLSAKDDLNSL